MVSNSNNIKEGDTLPKQARARKSTIFFRILFLLILIPILCSFLLQVPAIQNWTVDKIANYFSNKLETRVEIDKVRLSLIDGGMIDGFFIEDLEGDTLLYSAHFQVDLSKNLFLLYKNELGLDRISLDSAIINIKKNIDGTSNVQNLLSKLITGKTDEIEKGEGKAWDAIINEIEVNEVWFNYDDQFGDQETKVYVKKGFITNDTFDPEKNEYRIKQIFFENPTIRITKNKSGSKKTTVVTNVDDLKDQIESATVGDTSRISITELIIEDGIFSFDDFKEPVSAEKDEIMDYKHFEINELDFNATSILYSSEVDLSLVLNKFSFQDEKGFRVNQFEATDVSLTDRKIELKGLNFKTDQSRVTDYISFKYKGFSDFKDFANKVYMKANLQKSQISIKDLLHFVPDLNGNSFFMKNKDRTAKLSGNFAGRVRNLSGRKMKLSLGDEVNFVGSFSSRNLNGKNEALINLKIDALETNISKLERVIPDFKPTSNFYRLGDVKFTGRVDGYFLDFVAFGTLDSEIGSAGMDMRLDVKSGKENANYSGEIRLDNFDLQEWTQDESLGKVSLTANVDKGKGLLIGSAFADLNAKVKVFEYRGYKYQNILMDGELEQNNFSGNFSIKDDNIDLEFDGNVFLDEANTSFDFTSSITKLDLQKLNLLEEPMIISSSVDMNGKGNNISDFVGAGTFLNTKIYSKDTLYTIDSLAIESFPNGPQDRTLSLSSEIVDANIRGRFNLNKLPNTFKSILKKNFNYHTRNWTVKPTSDFEDFTYQVHLKNSKNLLELAGVRDLTINDLNVKGLFNSQSEKIEMKGYVQQVAQASNKFFDAQLSFSSEKSIGELNLLLDSLYIGKKKLNPTSINATSIGDSLDVNIATRDILDSIRTVDINVLVSPHEKGYKFHFSDNDLDILGSKWKFSHFNSIVVGNEFIDIDDFEITDGTSAIILRDINEKGLALNMTNFDFLLINGLIDYDNIDFGGKGELGFVVSDLYGEKDINLSLDMPVLYLNEDPFGHLFLQLTKKVGQPFDAGIYIKNKEVDIWAEGKFDQESEILDAKLKARNAPFDIMEYIISEGISESVGSADMDVDVTGTLSDLKLNGLTTFNECGLKIDYLGTYYTIDKQTMTITEDFLGFEGQEMNDILGNTASVRGGLHHQLLSDFRLDVDMTSDDIIALNTTPAENPLYYGFGKGAMDISFRGPFSKTDIYINAVTGPETKFSIPIEYSNTEVQESFIEFIDRDLLNETIEKTEDDYKIEGLNIEMNLTITDDATMEIIFNEKLGDIIEGQGEGDLQIAVKRSGEFTVFGDYEIERGKYLFTAGELLSKSFSVKKGGLISWTGDPINAQLDLEAEYDDLRTNLRVFLNEYFTSPDDPLALEASRRTDVDLSLFLTGTLFAPAVDFDLDFPDLQAGALKSYAETKLRTLRSDKNGFNAQVAGLIIFKSFVPYNNPLGGEIFSTNSLVQSSTTTLSEFISSQFSILLSGLLNELIGDNSIFSSIDMELGLTQNSDLFTDNPAANAKFTDLFNPDEIQLAINPRFKFFDEKLSARIGGEYVRDSRFVPANSIIPDIAFEYFVTDDRKLKIRVFGRYDFDQLSIQTRRRERYGLGLSWRHEFGDIEGYKTEFNKALKKALDEAQENQ